jgi:glutamine synthetase
VSRAATLDRSDPVLDRDAVARFVEEHHVHSVELGMADCNGGLRGKRVPAPAFLKTLDTGVAVSNALFVFDVTADLVDSSYANFGTGYPDVRLVPDLGTLRALPWRPGTALVICDCVDEHGDRVELAPRQVLERVVAEARELGYEPEIGPELEFFLLDPETRAPERSRIPCYSLFEESRFEPVLADIRNHLGAAGVELEASNAEYAPGQFEVNVRHSGALDAADATMIFRYAVKQIAAAHGLVATFMAKPFTDFSGSGFHVHHSLWSDGSNAFATEAGTELSDAARHFVAGLLRHIADLTLLGAPTPNAYKRRVDLSFAPVNSTWGTDNRTVAVRAPEMAGAAARVEQRDAVADANPYLVIAAQLAAGLDGVRRELEPPPMTDRNAYEALEPERLPRTLDEAIARFERSDFARGLCGDALHEIVLSLARHELELYGNVVTDWERERYLETS